MVNRMQTYNSNIVGSNTYFNTKRHKLEALITQKDPCTIWYTLSPADNHWVDLYILLYEKIPLPDIFDHMENTR